MLHISRSTFLKAGCAVLTLSYAGCSAANDTANNAVKDTGSAVKSTTSALTPAANIGDAPSGLYKSESGHAYISMSYDHQGYSRPILRWGEFDARVNVDNEAPENSTLNVEIDVASIDSGVDKFDDGLLSEEFFNVAVFPKITFTSTSMKQLVQGHGKVTGELTVKDITKPVTLDVTLNKVGKHFRSQKDLFGISAKTTIRRDDFGVGLYDSIGQEVDIQIEVEFIKAE